MADSDNDSGGGAREQDRFLPINVSMIMKNGLPANAKISKDAKETVQECISEFISFITGASDKCQREKRKTINGDDLHADGSRSTWSLSRFTSTSLERWRVKMTSTSTGAAGTATGTGMSAGHGRHSDEYHHDYQREQLHVHGHGAAADNINGAHGGMAQSTTMMMRHQQQHQGHLYGSGYRPATGHGRPR